MGEAKSIGVVRAGAIGRLAGENPQSGSSPGLAALGEQHGPVDFASGKRKGSALGVSARAALAALTMRAAMGRSI